ncbi:wax ester/triacylglycerol synthase family O-acyltransferase [Streptomyces sp. NPDC051940]|uniref:wax ester/triacylglycerol synthase family O-acyltransferase n=1 Tax=Streptomyces sp. NPDC051940 TaxID=3155675 RepID=UPI00342FC4D3
MPPEPLAPLDLAFWHLESPRHPMHLGALGVFEASDAAAAGRAAALLAERCAAGPGLRMRIRDTWLPAGGAVREPAGRFDPAEHVRLMPPAADFHAVAGEVMARPLDRGRPPWEARVIPAPDGRRFAVLFAFHHALADGLRALTLAAGVMDPVGGAPARPSPAAPAASPGGWGFLDPVALARRQAADARRQLAEAGRAAGIGAGLVRASWGLPTTPPVLAAAGAGGRLTAGAVLDLDDVHHVRKRTGGTVNDVLIAVVAGALRRWLEERGEPVGRLRPRALIPVSRRRPRAAHPQGNRLSGYLVRLPVSDPDPLGRMRAVRRTMDRRKEAGPDQGAGAVALLADLVPPLGHRLGGPVVARAARLLFDVLVTSVPLPSLGLRLAGCPLTEVYPLAPLAQGHALAVAVSTYRGRVHYGLVADARALPDVDVLAGALGAELAELRRAALAG